jgi:hypothetical protein
MFLYLVSVTDIDTIKSNKVSKILKMIQKDTKELRVRDFPLPLHKRVRKYVNKVGLQENRELNKGTASIELIDQALKQHGL